MATQGAVQQSGLSTSSTVPNTTSASQQQQSHTQHQQGVSTEAKFDNVAKVKGLIWHLKEAFANVIKVAAANIYHNSSVDNGMKTGDDTPPRLDKSLEEVFSICNQIELHLKTIQECSLQLRDSQQYLPLPVLTTKTDVNQGPTQDTTLSYSQYLATVKSQVAFAKNVQEILTEGARKITQNE
ncbi:mediator complex subunit intersex [Tachypleus tridentatus]|uniref:mediator complex subunit intersex n=1 Tax=Tachypleus tridentatus TaxID=6853 RepID=UPI003FD4ED9A